MVPVQASTLNLSQFLNARLKTHLSLKIESEKLDIRKSQLYSASDLFQTSLGLSYSKSETQREYESLNIEGYESSPAYMEAKIQQGFSWGGSFSFNSRKYTQNSQSSYLDVDTNYNFTLSQSLWRNALGSKDKNIVEGAQQNYKMQKIEKQYNDLITCTEVINDYLQAFKLQEQLNIYKEKHEGAKQALAQSEKHYLRRLIRKIDLLSAQADIKQSELQYLDQKTEYSLAYNKLKFSKPIDKLLEPKFTEMFDTEPLTTYTESLSLKQTEIKILSDWAAVKLAREDKKVDIQLQLSMGENQGELVNEDGYKDRYLLLSLNMEWLANGKTYDENLNQALMQHRITVLKQRQNMKDDQIAFKHLIKKIMDAKNKVSHINQRLTLFTDQVQESEKLLRNGRIEFEDYLRFRDNFYNERLRWVEQKTQLWSMKVSLLQYGKGSLKMCGVTL